MDPWHGGLLDGGDVVVIGGSCWHGGLLDGSDEESDAGGSMDGVDGVEICNACGGEYRDWIKNIAIKVNYVQAKLKFQNKFKRH